MRLTVFPLEDLRGTEVKEEYWRASMPFVPHGVTFYDRPEAVVDPEQVDEILFDPPRDFPRHWLMRFGRPISFLL